MLTRKNFVKEKKRWIKTVYFLINLIMKQHKKRKCSFFDYKIQLFPENLMTSSHSFLGGSYPLLSCIPTFSKLCYLPLPKKKRISNIYEFNGQNHHLWYTDSITDTSFILIVSGDDLKNQRHSNIYNNSSIGTKVIELQIVIFLYFLTVD